MKKIMKTIGTETGKDDRKFKILMVQDNCVVTKMRFWLATKFYRIIVKFLLIFVNIGALRTKIVEKFKNLVNSELV